MAEGIVDAGFKAGQSALLNKSDGELAKLKTCSVLA